MFEKLESRMMFDMSLTIDTQLANHAQITQQNQVQDTDPIIVVCYGNPSGTVQRVDHSTLSS